MDTEARDGNLGYQLDIYECLEIVHAETSMVDRQGNECTEDIGRAGSVRALYILRSVDQVHQA